MDLMRKQRIVVVTRLCLIADAIFDFGLSVQNKRVTQVAASVANAVDRVALVIAPKSYLSEKATGVLSGED